MEAFIESIEPVESGHKDFLNIYWSGCNFKCPWCNTPHLLESKEEFMIPLRDAKLQIKEHMSQITEVIFTGGEPCLQRLAVMNLAEYCKQSQLRVGVHTNGSKPICINSLLKQKLLDSVILDIKSPLEEESFEKITKSRTFFISTKQIISDINATLEILKDANIDIEIRTTIIPGWMYRKEDLIKIAELIKKIDCRWKLQRFEPGEIVSKRLSEIMPPSEGFMEDLREALQKKYPNLRIDISD
ncbi:MAG: radical SAM protein [Candidatus Nanoarchaeia archaeon]